MFFLNIIKYLGVKIFRCFYMISKLVRWLIVMFEAYVIDPMSDRKRSIIMNILLIFCSGLAAELGKN